MQTLEQKYEDLLQEFEQYKKESIKWSVEDFNHECLSDEYSLTEEQAQKALEDMIDSHDCNNGISWNTLECYKEMYGVKIEQ